MATSGKIPFATEGATITIGAGSTDIKANIIDEPTFDNPEPSLNEFEGSDGTNYSFPGSEGTATATFPIVWTTDNMEEILESIYGAGSAVSGGKEWALQDAGGTVNNITITTPETSDGVTMKLIAVNASGLRASVQMPLKSGFLGELKFKCDNWKIQRLTS